MTGAEYARKHFNGGETWLKISSTSYNAGHSAGYQKARKELADGKLLREHEALKQKYDQLKKEHDELDHMLDTGEGLGEYLSAL